MRKFVLILAGGEGKRFSSEIPKQFANLNGKPVLMHTFEAFSFLTNVSFILVLPKNLIGEWKQLCEKYNFTLKHQLAEAGPKRFHSVKSGLKFVPDECLVAIHDGVRPLVSKKVIENCYNMAKLKKSAVPVQQISDSVRQVDGLYSRPVSREDFRLVQTPQVFHSTLIKKAYFQNYSEEFTDDAVVFEKDGHQIFLTEGNPENIKITNTVDLRIAENLLKV